MTPAGELTVVVHITDAGGALGGNMESPDQAPGQLIPLAITEAKPDRLAFDVPSIKASYAGVWDNGAGAWSGTWSQSGYKFPLVLHSGPAAIAVKGMDGVWEAKVQRGDVARRLILRIASTAQGATIKFDAPDAGATNLAVNFSREGNHVRFSVPAAGAQFDGALAATGDRMDGTWSFPNQPPTPVVFARIKAQAMQAPRLRPQMPQPPFPYRVEEVRVANAAATDVTLGCTLTTPQGAGPFPAAALITGSGAQDRDESIFEHKPFAVLADDLTRRGVAVLRCDDRGVSRSTGVFATGTSEDFATDANAMVAFLARRPEIKRNAIGLIGHSEGGLVAPIAASTNPQIAFLVLLGAPGTNLRQLMLTQRHLIAAAQGIPAQDVVKGEPYLARILDAVAGADSDAQALTRVEAILTPDAMTALGIPAAAKALFVQQMANVWMRHFLRLDPASYLAKIKVPVLAIAGSLDCQVEPNANLAAIKAGLAHDADVTALKLEGLNHFFQHAKTGGPNEYAEIEETFSSVALQAVSKWITQRFSR